MRVLVTGATGCVGSAMVNALRSRGHAVVSAARGLPEGRDTMRVDFMEAASPQAWSERLRAQRIDAVVNCVGILMASRAQSFERIHAAGPIEMFRGAAQAGVARAVQISALGVASDSSAIGTPYLRTKLQADEALAALSIDSAVLRPSLVYGPNSQSAALFATLASLPVIGLPGRGKQLVQPIHVFELAEAAVRLLEQAGPCRGVYELAGPRALTYRDMLAAYRDAQELAPALWLPTPMPLMRIAAWAAEALPQKVFCRDTIAMLERGSATANNATPRLLGRAPSQLAHGLAVTPPRSLVDLHVSIPARLELAMRLAVAFMWLYTALITSLMPQASGVLALVARCGFEGRAGMVVMVSSCALNTVLGLMLLRRPAPWVWPLQIAAVLGYTITAAINMPELTLDHCGPLVKNVPVLALIVLLWLARPARDGGSVPAARAVGRRRAGSTALLRVARG